jgi:hypothetical protein
MENRGRALVVAAALCAPACASGESPAGGVEFSNLRIEDLAGRRAVLRFDTSVDTSCEALFGTAEGALDRSATDPDMVPGTFVDSHRIPLEDLLPQTSYDVRALAQTPEQASYESDLFTFATLEDGSGADLYENVALLSAGARVLGKSSNWSDGDDDSSFGANLAIDGLMNTAWSSAGDGDDAWLELDLGQERHLIQIGFRSRDMTDGTSIVQEFELSFDGEPAGRFMTPDPDITYVFPISPVDVQVVRVDAVVTTGGNTGIRELQLYSPKTD